VFLRGARATSPLLPHRSIPRRRYHLLFPSAAARQEFELDILAAHRRTRAVVDGGGDGGDTPSTAAGPHPQADRPLSMKVAAGAMDALRRSEVQLRAGPDDMAALMESMGDTANPLRGMAAAISREHSFAAGHPSGPAAGLSGGGHSEASGPGSTPRRRSILQLASTVMAVNAFRKPHATAEPGRASTSASPALPAARAGVPSARARNPLLAAAGVSLADDGIPAVNAAATLTPVTGGSLFASPAVSTLGGGSLFTAPAAAAGGSLFVVPPSSTSLPSPSTQPGTRTSVTLAGESGEAASAAPMSPAAAAAPAVPTPAPASASTSQSSGSTSSRMSFAVVSGAAGSGDRVAAVATSVFGPMLARAQARAGGKKA